MILESNKISLYLPKLANVLGKIDRATSRSLPNEAIIRLTVDMLLVYAHDIVSLRNSTAARSLCLQAESQWGYGPVERDNQRYRLVGKPDYALWYGEIEETAVNVVIVEAKRRHYASTGLPQCLAYMGTYLIICMSSVIKI